MLRPLAAAGFVATVALLAAFAPARTASACSICLAGDPNFTTHGTSSQAAGSVSVYFELRDFSKTSGQGGGALHRAGDEHAEEAPHAHASPGAAAVPGGIRRFPHGGHYHWDDEEESPAGAGAGDGDPEHGAHTGRESHDSRRLDLYVAWTPIDRLTLTLDVPWVFNDVTHREDGESTHLALDGFGDVSLGVSGVVWRNRPVMPSTWVELRAFGKAPTGRDERRVDGELDAHVQAGTGSWDFGFGSAVVHRLEWGSLYASGFYRVNTEGGLDYEYGDVALATLGVDAPLGHLVGVRALDRVTPGLALDFRWADRDEQAGHEVADTGGSILYVTPSVRVALPAFSATQRAWLRTGVQIPVTDAWLYGEQDEGLVWSVGIGYGF
jgi:hypothetical protein